ncbi:MAG: DnaT-like ssDNA-binding protein [Kluyvera sp.]|uniref:DnaT-like ssDNA-binding protein n=1 Tax=Kluyvera sp. TaxID=1538228 RepID=UPI003F3008FE
MPLIVEDGTIVAGADSYISLVDARALADKYGWVLPADDTEAEAALRNGAGYIGLQEPQMCGTRVSASQSLAYPRQNVTLYSFPVAADSIPDQIKQAQVIAAVEYGKGTDVRASTDGRATSMERVEGAVTVQYFNNGATGATTIITAAIDALRPLLCGLNNGFTFNVYRG